MDTIEQEMQDAAEDFLWKLRGERLLDTAAAQRLRTALGACAHAWAGSPTISKSAANLFVDLASATDACADQFAGEQQQAVRYLADELADLVRACVV